MINTSGFRLSQMPNYTPVDPSLVAMNPGAITQGIGASFQLANLLEQVKAQRQKRQLMDAIMQGQIEAENARNQATTATAMPGAQNTLGEYAFNEKVRPLRLSALEQTLPLEAERASAERKMLEPEFKYKTAKLGSDLRLLEPIEQATAAQAAATTAKANTDVNLNALRETTESEVLNSKIKDIKDLDEERKSRVEKALAENALAVTKAKTDNEMYAAADKLKQDKIKAEIAHLNGMADYYANGGRPAAGKDPATQINALMLAAKRLDDTYQLSDYEDKLAKSWNLPILSPKRSTEKDKMLKRRNDIMGTIDQIIQKQAGGIMNEISPSPITAAPRSGGNTPQVGAVVNGFRFNGGDPKNKANWEKLPLE